MIHNIPDVTSPPTFNTLTSLAIIYRANKSTTIDGLIGTIFAILNADTSGVSTQGVMRQLRTSRQAAGSCIRALLSNGFADYGQRCADGYRYNAAKNLAALALGYNELYVRTMNDLLVPSPGVELLARRTIVAYGAARQVPGVTGDPNTSPDNQTIIESVCQQKIIHPQGAVQHALSGFAYQEGIGKAVENTIAAAIKLVRPTGS